MIPFKFRVLIQLWYHVGLLACGVVWAVCRTFDCIRWLLGGGWTLGLWGQLYGSFAEAYGVTVHHALTTKHGVPSAPLAAYLRRLLLNGVESHHG